MHLCAVDFTVRQFISPLALALQDHGYDVRCACTPGPHWEELREMNVRMVSMPIARSGNPFKALRSGWRLYRWLRREKIDVLHCHTPVASMIGRVAGFLARVPHIFYTAHGFYFHDRMPASQYRKHVALERFFGRFNEVLFCVSEEDARAADRLRISKAENTFYISNGVDPDRFNPAAVDPGTTARLRKEFDVPEEAIVVAIMGRLVREKGYFEFFEAARRLAPDFPKAHFLVMGDTVVSEHDSAKEEILAAADHDSLKGRVHFTGLRRDIPELLSLCNIFCLPTYREGMPVSILEAMAMKLPVVTTNIRGCREEVVEGETGFLVEPRDAEGVEQALRRLLQDPALRNKMGEAGRARICESFDERKILQREVELYDQILSAGLNEESASTHPD